MAGGKRFLHEHPAGAGSWAEPPVVRLLQDPLVGSAIGHQCQHGQWTRDQEGNRCPARKSTR
eukprot:3502835-Alexandrium_andersonii.AAC.1